MTRDEDHLRLLSVFHYVVSGIAGLFALFPVLHLVMGLVFILAPEKMQGQGPPLPGFFGWMFVIMALVFITIGLTFAACVFATGRFLARRRHYLFCLVMAGVECVFMPFGTVLGVFAIVVLTRETVKGLFNSGEIAQASGQVTG